MNRLKWIVIGALLCLFSEAGAAGKDWVKYVNTLQGTNSSFELSRGNTYPAVAMPWGMNFWTPQTGENRNGFIYRYAEDIIRGFRQTHQCSPWANDYAAFSLMPVSGELKVTQHNRFRHFRHEDEIAQPHYYKVTLDNRITAEMSPTERGVFMRFTYPEGKDAYVVLDLNKSHNKIKIIPEQRKVVGYTTHASQAVPQGYANYFVIVFDQPIEGYGTWTTDEGKIRPGVAEEEGFFVSGYLKFAPGGQVNARVVSSFISEEQAEATASSNYSYWGSTFRAFLKNKAAVALLIALAAVVAFAFLQPYLPGQADPNLCAVDPVTGIQYRNIAPGQDGFVWGSNSIGQDLWARIWAGARTSLTIAFFVALIEAVVGITAGVLWGYVRGLDFVFTELYNIFDNIPTAIVLILISYVATPSIWTMILGMSIKGWIEMARFIRNQILIIRDRDYNVASRCIGTPTVRIVFRNLLPYLVSVIMLRMALTIPEAIGNEVFITYIGLGLSVETPSLGNLVNDGRKVMMQAGLRYQLLYPTLILSFVTIAFYLIGNAFSDAADPKNHLQ
mgnify:FL=1